jgi:hypothetical protein
MGYLSIVGSHAVNGVAQIHSDLLKTTLYKFSFFLLFLIIKLGYLNIVLKIFMNLILKNFKIKQMV